MYGYTELVQMVRSEVTACDPDRAQALITAGAGEERPPFDADTAAQIVRDAVAVYRRNTEPRITLEEIGETVDAVIRCGHGAAVNLVVAAGISHGLFGADTDAAHRVTGADADLLTQTVMLEHAEIHGGTW